MVIKSKSHFRRKRIIEEHLLNYIEYTDDSKRNKEIVIKYVNGISFTELSKEYNITLNRVTQIIANYILHACQYKIRNEK